MKKQILNLGKALNKAEQKSINGGGALGVPCLVHDDCYNSPFYPGGPTICETNNYCVFAEM